MASTIEERSDYLTKIEKVQSKIKLNGFVYLFSGKIGWKDSNDKMDD